MKLYKFDFDDYLYGKNNKIERHVLECEEKPKTYISKEKMFKTRIPKEEIGIVQKWGNLYILLIEDDFEKARKLYLEYYESKIESENIHHEKKMKEYHHKIEDIKESKA